MLHLQRFKDILMYIFTKGSAADLLHDKACERHSPVGVGCDCSRLVDLRRLMLAQRFLQTACIVRIPHHHIDISLLKSRIVVHQVQHRDRLIIRKIRQKSFWKIASDIAFQIQLPLFIQLHHAHPD